MFGLIHLKDCRCGGPIAVPAFSFPPEPPSCQTCGEATETPDLVSDARKLLASHYENLGDQELVLHFAAHTGSFHAAFVDGDKKVARAFLANVIVLAEMLLSRLGK